MTFTIWSVPSLFILSLAAAILYQILQLQRDDRTRILICLMLVTLVWVFAHLLRTIGTTLEFKVIPHAVLFPAAMGLAYFYGLFGLAHVSRSIPFRALVAGYVIFSALLCMISLLPATRHLMFQSLSVVDVDGFKTLSLKGGPLLNWLIPMSYLAILVGGLSFVYQGFKEPAFRSRAFVYAVLGLMAIPLHLSLRAIWLAGYTPVSLVPLGWGGLVTLFGWVFWRFHFQLQGFSDRTVLESLPDALFLADTGKKVVYFNRSAQQRVGKPESEIKGESLLSLLGLDVSETEDGVQRDVEQVLAGERYRHDIYFSRLRRTSGETMIYAVVMEDRTQMHDKLDQLWELQDGLLMQSEELEHVNIAKRRFLSVAASDMRSPLDDILDSTRELAASLARRPDAAESLGFVHDMQAAASHLLSVVEHISYYEQMGRETELTLTETDVTELFEEVCRQFRSQAMGKHISFVYEPDVIARGMLDRQRIRQILINLISNALKFTPEHGEVTVRSIAGHSHLIIEVVDTGIGIPVEDQERIFSAFQQVDSSLAKVAGGTGLGLPLVRRLARAHGGEVEVISSPGRGATFQVQIPWESDQPREEVGYVI